MIREEKDKLVELKSCSLSAQSCIKVNDEIVNFFSINFISEILGENIAESLNSKYNLQVQAHTDNVYCVAISSDDEYAASGSDDKKIIVWNIKKRIKEFSLEGHTDEILCFVFSPDNKYILSGSADCTVRVWSFKDRKHLAILENHSDSVCGIAVTSDGKYAITASYDKTLIV